MNVYETMIKLTMVENAGAGLAAIIANLVTANKHTAALEKGLSHLKVAAFGVAGAFAGWETLKFASHIEKAGEGLLHAKTMFEAALPAATRIADMAKITGAAWKETGDNMRTGIVGNIEAIHDLYNITGSTESAMHLLLSFNILKNMLDSVSDKASIGDAASGKNVANVVRAFERMGLADPAHPELMKKAMADYVRTMIGTRGRVIGSELFSQVQSAGDAAYGLSETFKTMGLPALMLLGGRRVGFGAYQMFNNLWGGGGGNLSSKMQAMGQEKWGLHSKADEIMSGGMFKGFRAGSVFEADKLRENPLEWANDYRQKLKGMGVNIEDMKSVQLVIADIARNNKNLKSMFDELLLPAPNRQFNKEMANIAKVGPDAAGVVNENDPRAWREKLSKQWGNLEDVFGEQLVIPFIDKVLKPLTEAFKTMAQWGAANPVPLKLIAEGFVAVGGALVAVGGVTVLASVFGAGGLMAAATLALSAMAALNWETLNKWVHEFSDGIRNLGTSAFEKVIEWIKSFGASIEGLWNKVSALGSLLHLNSFTGEGFGGGGGPPRPHAVVAARHFPLVSAASMPR